jgi:preprotein translocase subunit SecD
MSLIKRRVLALIILLAAGAAVWAIVHTERSESGSFKFKRGLDLVSGVHLVYRADVSKLDEKEVSGALTSLRQVIDRRINAFGVTEPLIQIEKGGVLGSGEERLIIELPGFTDVGSAIESIGKTPTLEFLLVEEISTSTQATSTNLVQYIPTGLTGALLKSARVQFDQTTLPVIGITFNEVGAALFAKITKENIGKPLAIFLDGAPISAPIIQSEITGGEAVINGRFSVKEARELARNLNLGALPVPIELVSTETIGASLGAEALNSSIRAGIWALILVSLFLIVWYRLPGIIAVLALVFWIILNLLAFKLFSVTLTAAGIAGFVLSIGMAVDANILIFERMKEERRKGKSASDALSEGFARAWLSIRDSNISTLITCAILFFFASTAIVKGFALVLAIGVVTSLFTAITISRTFLYAMGFTKESKLNSFLLGSGLKN